MDIPPANPRLPGWARLGHAKPLDGIRGVAVLAVLGHNFGIAWLQGGFFGVDLFFALSGFLITTLLLEEHGQRGSFSLGGFFARRGARLYPALILLVAVSALSSMGRPEVDLPRVGLVVASALLYFSNWLIIADRNAWLGGLGHTWSLAVEMHFYIGWALTLAFVTRRWGARLKPLIALALIVAVASASWRAGVWVMGENPDRAYAGSDTRLDAIFLGVTAALIRIQCLLDPRTNVVLRLRRGSVRVLEMFLAGAIGWLICRTPPYSPIAFLGGFGLVGGAAALLILTTLLSGHSVLVRPLQMRLLVWFGQISYSLYLWHLPVKKFVTADRVARIHLESWSLDVVRVLLSVGLAAASYYGVERAFLRLSQRMSHGAQPEARM